MMDMLKAWILNVSFALGLAAGIFIVPLFRKAA